MNELSGVPREVRDPLPDKRKASAAGNGKSPSEKHQFASPDIDQFAPRRKWLAGALAGLGMGE